MECASSSIVMCERLVKCASGPVIMCECGDVRVIGYVRVEMCEWFGHNVRVNMKCASASTMKCEWSGHNVRVR